MKRIEQDVRRELRRFGAPGGLPAVLEVWPEATGPEIARNAWPARIARDGTLHVTASSSAWAFELSQLAPDVLERLRERLGNEAPKAIRFAPGHVPELSLAVAEDIPERATEPGPEEVAEAGRIAAEIDDEELRKSVQRAAALSLVKSRYGR
jgi:hypothetical protein